MKKIFIILFFFIIGCSNHNIKDSDNYQSNFSLDMDMEEFKTKLKEYSKKEPYPNIDK